MRNDNELTVEEARERYDALGLGGWRAHSLYGTVEALNAVFGALLVRALHRHGRRERGLRAAPDTVGPLWAREAYTDLVQVIELEEPRPEGGHVATLMATEAGRTLISDLLFNGGLPRVTSQAPDEAISVLHEAAAFCHGRLSARGRPELEAFYGGTRTFFRRHSGIEPEIAHVALLAAARGIENDSWKVLVKHWGERIGRWRKKMDAMPGWQETLAQDERARPIEQYR